MSRDPGRGAPRALPATRPRSYDPPVEERRRGERHRVWHPVTVVTEDGHEGTAITFDVSSAGLLLAAPGPLAVGARLTLRFRVEGEPEDRALGARVVRVEPHGEAPWRHRLAVELDAPHPGLEALLSGEPHE